ncbi:MAG: TolC family protein [Candidatus Omnitrophica bacterium]|nr:TolC family protein [Candidatus Omnitrophota bacterium]
MKLNQISLTIFIIALSLTCHSQEKAKKINLKEFIETACQNDSNFTQILIDELKLKYKKSIALPAKDLVFEVQSKYGFFVKPEEKDFATTSSLTKLFPSVGTEISAEYSSSVPESTRKASSGASFEISQPIAQNAFGRNTRLLDRITGLEIEVARYQIAEAYEDYLASLIVLYYSWYSAYENLKTAENSYNENAKLLENIKERQENKIALPIDVNKISLQVLAKKENLVSLENDYKDYYNRIKEALRYSGQMNLLPEDSSYQEEAIVDFSKDIQSFKTGSRTIRILKLLEDKSTLEVDKYADELLPSIDLLFGHAWEGSQQSIEKSINRSYAGLSFEWPFPGQVEHAQYETSKISQRKQKLATESATERILTSLANLNNQMQREKELIAVAEEKIKLAEEIVKDEKENYSLGRSTLNDLIDEVNKLEDNKFNKITHNIQLRKLVIEWWRLSDVLIKEDEILADKKISK